MTDTGINRHIEDFLDYYLTLERAPNYAVMLNGPWGVGKTYFIRAYLSDRYGAQEGKYLYVSLFGLKTREEIDDALAQAAYPALGWKITKVGVQVSRGLLKRFGGIDLDMKLEDIIGKLSPDVLIFDDLERCELEMNAVLGYINEFVEHGDGKVIVVANEAEIKTSDEYRRRREKLIGRTLVVRSEFENAFRHFVSLIDDSATKAFLLKQQGEISSIYHQSDLNNFRILLQTLWDFERVFSVLTEEQQRNAPAAVELLRLFSTLSFEFRSGRLQSGTLRNRLSSMEMVFAKIVAERERAEAEPDQFELMGKRYAGVNVYSELLPNVVLADIIIDGIIDERAIRDGINASPHFASTGEEEPWRTLWHWTERSDEQIASALATVRRQISEQAITDVGQFMQVFSLLIYFAEEGATDDDPSIIASDAKVYIDSLYNNGQLRHVAEVGPISERSVGGLGYYPSPKLKDVFSHLRKRQNDAFDDLYPKKASDLLDDMERDATVFFRKINLTNDGSENEYHRVPIFTHIKPTVFVERVLRQPPAAQRTIFLGLQGRYEHAALERDLKLERPWLAQVHDLFEMRAAASSGIYQYRLRKFLEWNINKYLDEEVS